ncbi:MAG: 2-oxo acid dehydrogenase subunit E2 [Anaerolineae bacterium]|nr:2-oxo acid dehydrogenase subunit E2 [Anaerolineae bacterium]
MAEVINMPKLGFDMQEGQLVNWVKKEGDTVQAHDIVAEIESDKATVEVETYAEGTLLKLLVSEGDIVPIGAPIAIVGAPGEKYDLAALGVEAGGEAAPEPGAEAAPAEAAPAGAAAPAPEAPAVDGDGKGLPGGVRASPVARRVAREAGIDLRQVSGTGPEGRIVKSDVETFKERGPAAAPAAAPAGVAGIAAAPTYGALPSGPDVEVGDTSPLRARIGARMVQSKQQVPHFYVTSEIDVAALLDLRKQLNDSIEDDAEKITVNDLVVKATALTLRRFPNLNAHYYGEKTVRNKRISIGMAVALPQGGLINVVAKDADRTALATMARRNKEMIGRAREGKIRPDDVEGSTFTVSNLGPYDVEHFVAIINPPEAGISRSARRSRCRWCWRTGRSAWGTA